MTAADRSLAPLLEASISVAKQARASKQLRAANEDVRRAYNGLRHAGADDRDAKLKALEAFHTIACAALGLEDV